ncbi:hypothetical protein [Bacillus sp. PS06]|uniref:hypothetical protein n=1 Tax=Bacillus sp. PS06 TaxID=2764176 RepID=UPI00178586DE|nr:hypothetical protein [Bacillus sp. PS06]MBD8071407.1 hypothetical protein [Bacillus sp. PS06]
MGKLNSEIHSEAATKITSEATITKVSIKKIGESDITVFEEEEVLETFTHLLSSAVKEEGIVNMANPEYHLEIVDANEDTYRYYLWIGESGERTTLMWGEDTHTIYTVSQDFTDQFIDFVK